ncbi:hypothetical protein CcNV_088 [Crangon crangon nudivirus]|uniref:Uncharacterized protein n=1 Tax=Crangon crangon nudivirus TaxID=2880838 RepID=A0AAE9BZ94_9VIRU|nr:hypothetical protein QKT25_gp089 [Crangon crangon nudivirus]UBZ25573.1 hypothetical protein CcNV_088 [Crangon crangon nudivirus]
MRDYAAYGPSYVTLSMDPATKEIEYLAQVSGDGKQKNHVNFLGSYICFDANILSREDFIDHWSITPKGVIDSNRCTQKAPIKNTLNATATTQNITEPRLYNRVYNKNKICTAAANSKIKMVKINTLLDVEAIMGDRIKSYAMAIAEYDRVEAIQWDTQDEYEKIMMDEFRDVIKYYTKTSIRDILYMAMYIAYRLEHYYASFYNSKELPMAIQLAFLWCEVHKNYKDFTGTTNNRDGLTDDERLAMTAAALNYILHSCVYFLVIIKNDQIGQLTTKDRYDAYMCITSVGLSTHIDTPNNLGEMIDNLVDYLESRETHRQDNTAKLKDDITKIYQTMKDNIETTAAAAAGAPATMQWNGGIGNNPFNAQMTTATTSTVGGPNTQSRIIKQLQAMDPMGIISTPVVYNTTGTDAKSNIMHGLGYSPL